MSATALLIEEPPLGPLAADRLAVAWQHPVSRSMAPVGLLSCHHNHFAFDYLRSAEHVAGFQPFIGFPDLGRHYESSTLFPLFAQRVMRRGRPDFARYVDYLTLTDPDDWSILARTHGQREGDGVRVFAEPSVDASGVSSSTFFVSGLRYRLLDDPSVALALDSLKVGDRLRIVDEPDNPADARALLVTDRGQVALGWIPNVLLPHVHVVRQQTEPTLEVLACHGTDVPPAYRLLVQLHGPVPPGYQPFGGPDWQLASEPASD